MNAHSRILIVDENGSIDTELRAVFEQAQGAPVASTHKALSIRSRTLPMPTFDFDVARHREQAMESVQSALQLELPYAIAFVDAGMVPHSSGIETTRELLATDNELQIVICVTPTDDSLGAALIQFADSGRVTLLNKPFQFAETWLLAVALEHKWRLTHDMNGRLQRQNEQIVSTRRVMSIIEGCLEELEHTHDELHAHAGLLTLRLKRRQQEIAGTRDLTMFALAQLADSRDPETGEHLLRMRAYSRLLAEHLSEHGPYQQAIDSDFLAEFYRSTPLHDIGKVGIPDQILLKPGPLTYEEFETMKQHTLIGAEALESAANQSSFGGFLKMAAIIARSHHEKFDGSGYPDGLSGQEIPLCARITAVADVFDALTSARVYKEAMPCEQAREIILSQSGKHFDPAIVTAFVACYDEFLNVKSSVDAGHIGVGTTVDYAPSPLPLIEAELLLGDLPLLSAI